MTASDRVREVPVLAEPRRDKDRRIGAILVEQSKLTSEQVSHVLEAQQATGSRFGDTAVHLGLISVDDLRRAIADQYELPYLRPENRDMSSELVVSAQPFHPCAEQIRALRTQL